jgi:tRNA(Ile2) C34 agmatinyltransferase TiaS
MEKRSLRSFRPYACQRCGGTAYLEANEYGEEWRCLQCGRTVAPPRREQAPKEAARVA